MPKPFDNPYLSKQENQLINLPSGPIKLPRGTEYTLIGIYAATTNEVDNHRIAHNLSRAGDAPTPTAMRTSFTCKNTKCNYRMLALRNADEVALLVKGKHNHVVKPNHWKFKPVNDPATIDATIDEVLQKVLNVPSKVQKTVTNVPAPPKARRQPIARGMGKRKKRKTKSKWIRVPFDTFDAMVAHLMGQGATPYRQPYFRKGKIWRKYRCRHCNYVAKSCRSENPLDKCVLFEKRMNHREAPKVPPEQLDLYLEVPDPLSRRVPPGTVIVIDSDDERSIYEDDDDGEAEDVVDIAPTVTDYANSHVIVETAAVRVKAPLVDYPDSDDSDDGGPSEGDDAMEVDAPSDDTPKAPDGKDSQTTNKAAAVNVPSGDEEATAAGPSGSVVKDDTANEERIITAIDALCQLFQHRAKIASLDAAQEARHTTEGHQNTVNADSDPVREVFPEVDPTFKGYGDLKKMIYKDIPDAPKPPRRRKQARPMKVECIPAHGALSVWMARLRRLQDAVDEFVEQTRDERKRRKQRKQESTSSSSQEFDELSLD